MMLLLSLAITLCRRCFGSISHPVNPLVEVVPT